MEIAINPSKKILKNSNRLAEFEHVVKNKLNLRKRAAQLVLHKVNVLWFIGHGNHINATLNHPKLMEMCRTLMPLLKSKAGDADINQMLIKYQKIMTLKEKTMYPTKLKKMPALAVSLALQISTKEVICKRDFILIFVILLRAHGVQCRFVMNLATVPLRPPNSELSALKLNSTEVLHDLLRNNGKLVTERDTLNINDRAHWHEIVERLIGDKEQIAKELSAIKVRYETFVGFIACN